MIIKEAEQGSVFTGTFLVTITFIDVKFNMLLIGGLGSWVSPIW